MPTLDNTVCDSSNRQLDRDHDHVQYDDEPLAVVTTAPQLGRESRTLLLACGGGAGTAASFNSHVAGALSAHGIPVVGVDSLRYFWSARTPASGALDIDRLMRFYQTRWNKKRVILVGYSQGADVLPFMVNRLPPGGRERVALLVLMGLGQKADFEFRMTNWVMSSQNGLPIRPEVERLPDGMAMCIYGADEDDSNCPGLDPRRVQVVKMPGGHHFDGNYTALADKILQGVARR